ncbi:hypothetical protein [Brucella intermedia]|uniref:hypothetical protein n=1 Tax=Brucella intermedia TaxID=94625 RepID=UPI000DE1D9A2|nr:hypothetical protein [Brucella intermedia]WGG61971.1 hypothetical protein QA414_15760 [Brucella intermedia]
MKGPGQARENKDRGLDCQSDLESDFVAIVDTAIGKGWSHNEALNALFELARNHLIMCQALDEEQRNILARMKELESNGAGRKVHH